MTPLVLVVLAIYAVLAVVALARYEGRGERRVPRDEPADGYPGCFLCALSASAGDEFLAKHIATEHRPKDERRAA